MALREFHMRWDEKVGSAAGEPLWELTVTQDGVRVMVLTMGRAVGETVERAMVRLAPFLRHMSTCLANPYILPSDN